MKKLPWIIALLLLIINLALVYIFVFRGEAHKIEDQRVVLEMTKENKDFVMKEMRDFLESVQQINEGILNNNAQKVIDAGKKSGGSVIEHAPKGLMKTLPLGFKKLGFSTHDLFDEFTTINVTDFDPKQTQIKLNTLLSNCVACHRNFKIDVKK